MYLVVIILYAYLLIANVCNVVASFALCECVVYLCCHSLIGAAIFIRVNQRKSNYRLKVEY